MHSQREPREFSRYQSPPPPERRGHRRNIYALQVGQVQLQSIPWASVWLGRRKMLSTCLRVMWTWGRDLDTPPNFLQSRNGRKACKQGERVYLERLCSQEERQRNSHRSQRQRNQTECGVYFSRCQHGLMNKDKRLPIPILILWHYGKFPDLKEEQPEP